MDQYLFQSIFLSSLISPDPSKERSSAMKVMANLLSNSVASKLNWVGQRSKDGFSQMNSWKAMEGKGPYNEL